MLADGRDSLETQAAARTRRNDVMQQQERGCMLLDAVQHAGCAEGGLLQDQVRAEPHQAVPQAAPDCCRHTMLVETLSAGQSDRSLSTRRPPPEDRAWTPRRCLFLQCWFGWCMQGCRGVRFRLLGLCRCLAYPRVLFCGGNAMGAGRHASQSTDADQCCLLLAA